MRAAIPKLERRVNELKAFNAFALTEDDHAAKIEDRRELTPRWSTFSATTQQTIAVIKSE